MNTNKCKIWDNQDKKWFVPKYPTQGAGTKKNTTDTEEIFISQSGEVYLFQHQEGDKIKLTHDTPHRYEICNFTGHRDVQQKKWYINDVIKTKNGIGVLIWHRDRLSIGSGDANNYHAIDETDVKELNESDNIGNICETPDYYKLVPIK